MLSKQLDIKTFLKESENQILIDVRSPSEFHKGHIPGALNIPIFNDEERKVVGTIYKKTGKKEAVLKGLEFVQPKLKSIVDNAFKLMEEKKSSKIYVYCWRGGARSESVTWLLNMSGIDAIRLNSGYKAYRNFIIEGFETKRNFILLNGKTGSGKTEILKELKNLGKQMLDLEGVACHKGSAFGDLGQNPQPTTQQFENNLFKELEKLDPKKITWLENESPGIGSVFIPSGLRKQMEESPIINIELPEKERIKRITKEYGCFDNNILIEKIDKISRRLGSEKSKLACQAIANNELEQAIEVLLKYYDKSYTHYMKKHSPERIIMSFDLEKDNPNENAKVLVNCMKN